MTHYEVFHEADPEKLAKLLASLVAGCTGIELGGALYERTLKKIQEFLNAEAAN